MRFLESPQKEPRTLEIQNNHIETFRRRVLPKVTIKKGEIIKEENLSRLRPWKGTYASNYFDVIGSLALKDLEPLQVIIEGVDFLKMNKKV